MESYTKSQNIALLILRVFIATIFIYAAYPKLTFWSTPPAGLSAEMINLVKFLSITEPLGAVAVLAGFLTRLAAAGLSLIMIGAIYFTQFTLGIGFATSTGAGWNLPFMVLAGCIVLIAFGAGRWSVDLRRQTKN